MTDCSLYLISPPAIVLGDFLVQLEQAFAASARVKAFQLRLKNASDEEIIAAAGAMLPLCRARGVAFIMNDRPDLAVTCNMDGVHLGQEDMSAQEARKIVGDDRVIGVSCHASRHMAMEACEAGADYVAFGAFYPTTSKPQEKVDKWGVPMPDILTWWSEVTTIPCVAIGGITQENVKPLVDAGADFVAAITSVWNHPRGVTEAVKAFEKAMG
jgi:thiamine-phosphate pyrophosphorylase